MDNMLCLILYLSTIIFQSTSSAPIDCIYQNISRDVENIAFQLFSTLKMPRNSQYFKKSIQDVHLYLFFKNILKIHCQILNDIVIGSKIMTLEDYNSTKSFLFFEEEELSLTNLKSVEATILNEFAYNIPLISLTANVLKKKVSKIVFNNKTGLNPNESEFVKQSQRRKKNRLEVWDNKNTRRENEENKVDIENYPFMVSIFENGIFVCSGCIIRKELVISAASCLHKVYLNKSDWPAIAVRVLSNYVHRGGHFISVTEAVFHPNYDHKTMRNNLVLLHVSKGAFTKLPKIRRLTYHDTKASIDTEIETNVVKIVGWSTLHDSRIFRAHHEDVLISLDQLDVYDMNVCKRSYNRPFYSKTLCASLSSVESRSKYTVGCPSIVNSMLLGILSIGSEHKGSMTRPMVFTRIAPYVDWIHEVHYKILPILQGVVRKSDKRNGTLIKARRTGTYGLQKRKNKINSKQHFRKTAEIITNGKLGVNMSRLIDIVQHLNLSDNFDAIKSDFYGALAKAHLRNNGANQIIADLLLSQLLSFLQPGEKKSKRTKTKKMSTKKVEDELNLNWNIFFDDETSSKVTKLPFTKINNEIKINQRKEKNILGFSGSEIYAVIKKKLGNQRGEEQKEPKKKSKVSESQLSVSITK